MVHGAGAPHVQASAHARILALVDPALVELARLIRDADSDTVRLNAIRDILDRAGLKAADVVKQDGRVVIEIEYVGRRDA